MVFMSHQGLLLFSCMCGIHYFRPISAFLSRNVQSVVKSSTIFQKSRLSFTSLSSSSGHDYNSGNTIPPEIEQLMLRIRTHQESVPRPTYAEEVRTLIENSIKYVQYNYFYIMISLNSIYLCIIILFHAICINCLDMECCRRIATSFLAFLPDLWLASNLMTMVNKY